MILNIGFDIGDAETVVAFLKGNSDQVTNATMPGKTAAGQAIPTLYGYTKNGKLQLADSVASDGTGLQKVAMNFKRCPSDIITADQKRKVELKDMKTDAELWNQPEMNTLKVRDYDEKLNTFIKVVFTHPDFEKILATQLDGCDECRVCVGHPTRWNPFEVRIYEAFLRHGILGQRELLGKKLFLEVERESRASFLYLRDAYQLQGAKEFIGVIDVGSSTIDISVMKNGDARDRVYDDGQNFLGARSIDYLIMEYCIDKLSKGDMAEDFRDIFAVDSNGKRKNPGAWDHMLINCRFAKEALFAASGDDKSRLKKWINILDFPPVMLKYSDLVDDICNRPVANVLKKYCDLSDEDYARMGNKNWKEAFREFLTVQKDKMAAKGISLSQIFMTGSASRMFFVRDICRDVFPEIKNSQSLMSDTEPSIAIANGLARVGVTEEKAKDFTKEVNEFLDASEGLRSIVKSRVPDLISDVAGPIVDVIRDKIIVPNFNNWKAGKITTINNLMAEIEGALRDEKRFNLILQQDKGFSRAAAVWICSKLGNDIGTKLVSIATNYHVHDFKADDLNAFKLDVDSIYSGRNGALNLVDKFGYEQFSSLISSVLGIIAFFISPYVVGVLVGLVAFISESAFWSILMAMMSIPDPLWLLLMAFLGITGAALTKTVFRNNKGKIEEWFQNRDLPIFVRKKVDVRKLIETFNADRDEIVKKLEASFNDGSKQDEIAEKISTTIRPQIEKKADEIKFAIERR